MAGPEIWFLSHHWLPLYCSSAQVLCSYGSYGSYGTAIAHHGMVAHTDLFSWQAHFHNRLSLEQAKMMAAIRCFNEDKPTVQDEEVCLIWRARSELLAVKWRVVAVGTFCRLMCNMDLPADSTAYSLHQELQNELLISQF